jgi:hypothetical protein
VSGKFWGRSTSTRRSNALEPKDSSYGTLASIPCWMEALDSRALQISRLDVSQTDRVVGLVSAAIDSLRASGHREGERNRVAKQSSQYVSLGAE